MKDRCDNCKFSRFRQSPAQNKWWECHKGPPIASPEDSSAWWPVVVPDDWCDEHKPGRRDERVTNAIS